MNGFLQVSCLHDAPDSDLFVVEADANAKAHSTNNNQRVESSFHSRKKESDAQGEGPLQTF